MACPAPSKSSLTKTSLNSTVAYDLLAGAENDADPDTAIVNAMRASNPDIVGRLECYAASAERSFYKAYRELTRQNEANLVHNTEMQMMERFIKAPLPDHPTCENRPQPVQNEPVAASELTTDSRQLTISEDPLETHLQQNTDPGCHN